MEAIKGMVEPGGETPITIGEYDFLRGCLEAVSKPQIAFENKAWSDEKAEHIH